MSKKPKIHFDSSTDETFTAVTGVDPYNLGYGTAVDDIQKYFKALGEALCFLMEIIPNKQISVAWKVSEECELKFTISKEV